MKYTQINGFEKHLQGASLSSFSEIYTLLSKDSADLQFAVDLFKKFLKGYYTHSVPPSALGEKEFLSILNTPSLFQKPELIHIFSVEKLSKDFQSTLLKELPALPKRIKLLLTGESLSKNSNLYKGIEKSGIVLDLSEEKPYEREKSLAEWLLKKSSEQKKKIAPEVVNALARGVSGSFSRLEKEWEKLSLYTLDKEMIQLSDLLLVELDSNETNWKIGEYLLQGNRQKALEIIYQELKRGESPIALLRLLRHQIQTALMIASYDQEGQSEKIQEKFPYLRGQMLERQLHAARSFGVNNLTRLLYRIDEYEFKAKDSVTDGELLFTMLICI